MNQSSLFTIGLIFLMLGALLMMLSPLLRNSGSSSVNVGGFIGPIPFGMFNTPIGWIIGGVIFAIMLLLWFLSGYR